MLVAAFEKAEVIQPLIVQLDRSLKYSICILTDRLQGDRFFLPSSKNP
jgi:hypothetical protein